MTNTPNDQPRKLSPSEEFALAFPDFEQSTAKDREWDPNARRAEQLRGVGGGLADAVGGEPVEVPSEDSEESVRQSELGSFDPDTGMEVVEHRSVEANTPNDAEKDAGTIAIDGIRSQQSQGRVPNPRYR